MPVPMYGVEGKSKKAIPICVDKDGYLILADAPPVSRVRMLFYAAIQIELAVIIYLLNEIVRSL